MLKIPDYIVDSFWLKEHINHPKLVVLDATIPKVGAQKNEISTECIFNALFFDLKNSFSDSEAEFPNTMLSPKNFELKVRDLGVYKDSCVVVYDQHGVYSSPRVWFMFQSLGFENIAVLNGGYPDWKTKGFQIQASYSSAVKKGDFTVSKSSIGFISSDQVLGSIDSSAKLIVDARSEDRFYGKVPEPRVGVRSGHIPNSKNLPYLKVLDSIYLKSKSDLLKVFNQINPNNKEMIFSCGSGITASILAFAATISGYKNNTVYDGSWTEWGSRLHLPIEV